MDICLRSPPPSVVSPIDPPVSRALLIIATVGNAGPTEQGPSNVINSTARVYDGIDVRAKMARPILYIQHTCSVVHSFKFMRQDTRLAVWEEDDTGTPGLPVLCPTLAC